MQNPRFFCSHLSELSDLFYICSIIVFHGNSFPLFEINVSVYYVQLESDTFVALFKTRVARAVLAWSLSAFSLRLEVNGRPKGHKVRLYFVSFKITF